MLFVVSVNSILLITIFNNITSASYCSQISEKYSPNKLYLSVKNEKKDVLLYWGSDAARAASALFAAIVRYGLGYQNVTLHQGPHSLQVLAAEVDHNPEQHYREVILALSTAWEPGPPPEWVPDAGKQIGLAGPRLEQLGATKIPARQQLLLYLGEDFRHKEICSAAITWIFYTNITALKECGFISTISSDIYKEKGVVYALKSSSNITNDFEQKSISVLEKRMQLSYLQLKSINRSSLFKKLRTSKNSFLFFDYDIWSEYRNVSKVQLPPCIGGIDFSCQKEVENIVSMRIGDVYILEEYAYQFLHIAHNFIPPINAIRDILEYENNPDTIEDIACEWAWKNTSVLDYWVNKYKNSVKSYELLIFYCTSDPDIDKYPEFLKFIESLILKQLNISNTQVKIRKEEANCSDINSVKNVILHYMDYSIRQRLLGVVVDGKFITDISKNLDKLQVPVILYDSPGIRADLTESVWLSSGQSLHLALVLERFLIDMKCTRFAIISEPSSTAERFVGELQYLKDKQTREKRFVFLDHLVKFNISRIEIDSFLNELRKENAKIILVNTNYEDALNILAVAEEHDMNEAKGYVWIVREWQSNNIIKIIKPVTISFWCRKNIDVLNTEGRKDIRDEIDKINFTHHKWPIKATAMIDAVLTLVNGFRHVFNAYPETLNDVHNKLIMQEFEKAISAIKINGTTQNLIYNKHLLEETVVFVEKWQGELRMILARSRANATARKVIIEYKHNDYNKYSGIDDGAAKCLVPGHPYLPICRETQIMTMIIVTISITLIFYLIYRFIKSHVKEYEERRVCEIIKKRQQNATLISDLLIDRSALTMDRILGTGRYGVVQLASLKTPELTERPVAAKYLCEDQDEDELIQEARILTSLHHNHIIRLIGVCIDDQPMLLLMEFAFFGDLLHYLQERWYLAEGAIPNSDTDVDEINKEADHVSARALTRMAREAASAVAYLSQQCVIHRDIRAANYMIDTNRSVKLADFGLARKLTQKGKDGAEYATLRRGLFPILTMAPECLNYGIFSTASDVWALGVLIFEIVTLGARPYGDMSLQTVKNFVGDGGQPSMPHDATPQTCALAKLCWQRKPEDRPTAAEVVAYLAENPCALRAAFEYVNSPPSSPNLSETSTVVLL